MTRPGRHFMFNGHLDVMHAGNEPGWTDSPWSGKIADGKVWGRSSLVSIFVNDNRQAKELAIQGAKIYAAGRGIISIVAGISIFPFFTGLSGVWFTFPFAEISTFICCFGIGAMIPRRAKTK